MKIWRRSSWGSRRMGEIYASVCFIFSSNIFCSRCISRIVRFLSAMICVRASSAEVNRSESCESSWRCVWRALRASETLESVGGSGRLRGFITGVTGVEGERGGDKEPEGDGKFMSTCTVPMSLKGVHPQLPQHYTAKRLYNSSECHSELITRPLWYNDDVGDGAGMSLLSSFYRVSILACNNLYSWCGHHLVRLHFERRVFDDKRPHVVTQTIRMQVTL